MVRRTVLAICAAIAATTQIPAYLQLTGLPGWTTRQSYSIAAKGASGFPALPPAENTGQFPLMMRTLPAERFHLKLRNETRQEPVHQLDLAKGGLKIQEFAAP
jgi:uncharacterized protein (TIGR03435 family)